LLQRGAIMPTNVNPIPQGYHSITPYLVVRDASRAIDFYKRAFDAKEIMRMNGPDGKVAHAEIRIGDSMLMLGDESPRSHVSSPQTLGGSTTGLMIYVDNVDKMYQQAVAAGAKPEMPLSDMFWGDRYGKVKDPFGHEWSLATHQEDVPAQEME